MTLRLLVFGGTGQVGTEIRRRAGPDLAVSAPLRVEADLADPDAVAALVARCEADAVVNAAAYTAVDRAEQDEALAVRINAEAPAAMARAAANRGLPFLHVSTDYVFDGTGSRPRREDDPPAPLSAYGRTKRAGEVAVAAAGGPHAMLRTAWVHSAHGRNFVRTMLAAGAARRRLTVVDDQIGGPTPAGAVAEALITIARAFAQGHGVSGLFHFTGAPAISWHGFAVAIFRRADWVATPEIVPIPTVDWPTVAQRPLNGVLDCDRIRSVYGLAQPDWLLALDGILAELRERTP